MIAIRTFYHRCRLSFLRLRVVHLSSAIHRADMLYQRMLSRAFFKLSVLEWRYSQGIKRYFAAQNQGKDDHHEF